MRPEGSDADVRLINDGHRGSVFLSLTLPSSHSTDIFLSV